MRRDDERLRDILERIDSAQRAVAGKSRTDLGADPVLPSAIQYHLLIIGEAASNISFELRKRHPQVPWNQIRAFRNILVHEYFSRDLDIIWQAVSADLPPLRAQIEQILKAEFPD